MIGLDTNVLVRYITRDDLAGARQADRLIEEVCSEAAPGLVNDIVLCELIWVLEDVYAYAKADLAGVVEELLKARQLMVADSKVVWSALRRFRDGAADFADCLIAARNEAFGCENTFSFDRKAVKAAGMSLPI